MEVYIRLAPCPAPHHLEAEATLSNNPGENYISFHTKDVFDSVKLDSNSRRCLEVLERVWDWLGMGLWRIVGAVLSWEDEDYRRLCYLTWSTWGKVAGVRVEEVDFGSGMRGLFEKLRYFQFWSERRCADGV